MKPGVKLACGHTTRGPVVAVFPGNRKRWRCTICQRLVARTGR